MRYLPGVLLLALAAAARPLQAGVKCISNEPGVLTDDQCASLCDGKCKAGTTTTRSMTVCLKEHQLNELCKAVSTTMQSHVLTACQTADRKVIAMTVKDLELSSLSLGVSCRVESSSLAVDETDGSVEAFRLKNFAYHFDVTPCVNPPHFFEGSGGVVREAMAVSGKFHTWDDLNLVSWGVELGEIPSASPGEVWLFKVKEAASTFPKLLATKNGSGICSIEVTQQVVR